MEPAVKFIRSDSNLLRCLKEIIYGQVAEGRLSYDGKRFKFFLKGRGPFNPNYSCINQEFINGIKNLKSPLPIDEVRKLCDSSPTIEERNKLLRSRDSSAVTVVCSGWFLRIHLVRATS